MRAIIAPIGSPGARRGMMKINVAATQMVRKKHRQSAQQIVK